MKKIFLIFFAVLATTAYAQRANTQSQTAAGKQTPQKGYYTQYYGNDTQLVKEAQQWLERGEWRNGFDKANAHASVNAVDFYRQYQKNPQQWKALFSWLANTDLMALPKGKYPIAGSNLTVSVEESQNAPLAKRRSESHNHHIDFQYVVKGTERFGIIDHYTSTPNCPYKPDVIHYDYDKGKTLFYDSTPDEFFIFFPRDWHIAKIANDTDNQQIKVIVIKVDYVE